MSAYQPKTGQKCSCRRGIERDNCPTCEGTGWVIDFKAIRERKQVFSHYDTLIGEGRVIRVPVYKDA